MITYDTRKWLQVVLRIEGSVIPSLIGRIIITAFIGIGAAWIHEQNGFKLPTSPHTLVGLALGLLLVFRTNTSYDRYWEARKLFGSIVNRTRDLMRQIVTYFDGDMVGVKTAQQELQKMISVFYGLILQHLRYQRELGELEEFLSVEEQRRLSEVNSRPVIYLTWLSQRLKAHCKAGHLSEYELQSMDVNLTALLDSLGGCERILKTPIPFAYAQHIKGFLTLFCFTAPFVLVDSMGYYNIFAAPIITYALFGIEEIGVEIEDPFGDDPNDLPLEAIGQTIKQDTQDILGT